MSALNFSQNVIGIFAKSRKYKAIKITANLMIAFGVILIIGLERNLFICMLV